MFPHSAAINKGVNGWVVEIPSKKSAEPCHDFGGGGPPQDFVAMSMASATDTYVFKDKKELLTFLGEHLELESE